MNLSEITKKNIETKKFFLIKHIQTGVYKINHLNNYFFNNRRYFKQNLFSLKTCLAFTFKDDII